MNKKYLIFAFGFLFLIVMRKVEIYKKLGLNLLSLFPFDNIKQKLNFLLQYSESQKVLEDFR